MPIRLRAEFLQTWWSFQIHMWNPDGETPIKDSVTTYVEPFRRDRLNPPGICYFFKQVSQTANLADDTEFYGAARLTYDCATDQLAGLAWTSRMWLRAMNTAATITMKRPAVPTE